LHEYDVDAEKTFQPYEGSPKSRAFRKISALSSPDPPLFLLKKQAQIQIPNALARAHALALDVGQSQNRNKRKSEAGRESFPSPYGNSSPDGNWAEEMSGQIQGGQTGKPAATFNPTVARPKTNPAPATQKRSADPALLARSTGTAFV